MIINRQNYEELFLLYIDNELDGEGRLRVEEFLAKNPDLKEEMDTLMQFKLSPDTNIVFENKSMLTKVQDGLPVNAANYSDWLLLYIDNELNPSERVSVETFLTKNPAIAKEFALLQQTKLQPESILMPGKQSLYRREAKRIPMRWWRVAAAALLILTAGITTAVLLSRKTGRAGTEVAGNEKKVTDPVKPPVIENKKEDKQPQQLVNTNSIPTKNNPVSRDLKQEMLTKASNNKTKIKNENDIQVPRQKDEPVIVKNNNVDIPRGNDLPSSANNPYLNRPIPNNATANIENDHKESATKLDVTPEVVQTSYNPDNDLDQSGGKKNKLRGFLRKVTRTFQKNTNIAAADDDDRLLIGGLAFKLK